ncbi:MAG: 4-oxalocrotonate tautomerase family protein [Deltaproteobacteria bacterium]
MPILNVKLSARPTPALSDRINAGLLELTSRILHKKPHLTAIAIDYVPPEHWYVGGKTLAEQKQSSFYFDIKIVEGTNTKDEKARYVAESFGFFAELLGDVHPESYIYVQDVRADAYGFGGKTQEYRYIKGQL